MGIIFKSVNLSDEEVSSFLPSHFNFKKPNRYGMGASLNGKLVGVLLYEDNEVQIEILHIEVGEDYRDQGIGSALLQACMYSFYGMGMVKPVMITFMDIPALGPFKSFMEKQVNFEIEEDDILLDIPCEEVARARQMFCSVKTSEVITSFSDVNNLSLKRIVKKLEDKDIPYLHDLFENNNYERDLSKLIYSDDTAQALIAMKHFDEEKYLEVSFLYSESDAKSAAWVSKLIASVFAKAEQDYPDYGLYAVTGKESVERLIRKVFGSNVNEVRLLCASWDYTVESD